MPAELNELVTKLKAAVDKQKAIATNTGVDDIDLTELEISVEALANDAFNVSNVSMASLVALRDAYDFVASMARLSSVYTATRTDYYALAGAQLDKYVAYAEYLQAFLTNLENLGKRS